MPFPPRPDPAWLVRFLIVSLACYLGGRLGFSVPFAGSHLSLIWPASGIALAALLRWNLSLWPAVWLGAFAVHLMVGDGVKLAFGIACGNTLGVWLAAWMLRRLAFHPGLQGRRDLLLYLLIGVLGGMAVNATNGMIQLWTAGAIEATAAPAIWFIWWLRDAMGALVVGIPLLAVSRAGLREIFRGRRAVELGGALLLTVAAGAAVFFGHTTTAAADPLLYLPFFLLCWLAIRGGAAVASIAALLLSVLAVWGTALGGGPFHSSDEHHSIAMLWGYMGTATVITVLITVLLGELKDSERRLTLATVGAQLGLWELDLATDRLQCSGDLETILGVDPARLGPYRADWDALMPAEDRVAVNQRMAAHLAGRTDMFEAEFRMERRNGGWTWVLCRGQVVERSGAGEPLRVAGTLLNVDDRKRSEAAVQQSEHRLRQAFETNQAIKLIIDPADGRIEDANQAACEFYGYSREKLLTLRISDINTLPPEEIEAEMTRARSESRLYFNFSHRLASGEVRDVEVYSGPINTAQGLRLYSIIHDITDRKRAEGALRSAEERYRSVVENIREVVFQTDGEGRWTYLNRAWAEVTGFAVEDSLGRPYLDFVHPDEREASAGRFRALVDGREDNCRQEVRYLHRDGGFRWLEVLARRTLDTGSAEAGLSGTLADITERRAAEEKLRLAASVFRHSHEGIILTNDCNVIVDVNDAFTRITGYARSDVVGQNVRLLRSGVQSREFYEEMWAAVKAEGHWHGELWDQRKDGELYPCLLTISAVGDPGGRPSHYVGVFTDISHIKRHQRELEQIAHFDALTHLPNRILLADRMSLALAQAARNNTLVAVCYVDLDGFKAVNDDYGHSAGDDLLVEVARRLKDALRAGDTVARLGGDEFVLVLVGLTEVEECERVLQRVIESVREPVNLAEAAVTVSASIGVAIYPNADADADTLLRHADQAMYVAKQAGKNRYQLFDPEHDRRARNHRARLRELDRAIGAGELVVYYQPQVNMRTGMVVGAEALLRWHHPQQGLLPPGEFLPGLNHVELECRIGRWVLEAALTDAERWAAQGLEFPVSVNIAGAHLEHPDFVPQLAALLAAHPAARGRLELEVLESAALEDVERVADVINACRKLGVGFALDDFGTGYSSLTYFRRLPADTLKIDKSFVRDMLDDPDDLAIVEGVVGLTRTFGRRALAEGVETIEHGLVLLQLGCELAQGFGIARPMPAGALPDWVASWHAAPEWSTVAQVQWRREDLPLLIAPYSHRRWVDALLASLSDPARTPEMNPALCRLGRWVDTVGSRDYGDRSAFTRLRRVHQRVHVLGDELIALRNQGRGDEAIARSHQLFALRDELLAILEDLLVSVEEAARTPA